MDTKEVLEALYHKYRQLGDSKYSEALLEAIKEKKAVESAKEVLPKKKPVYGLSAEKVLLNLPPYTEWSNAGFNEARALCIPIFAKLLKERDELQEINDWYDNLVEYKVRGKYACLKDYVESLQAEIDFLRKEE